MDNMAVTQDPAGMSRKQKQYWYTLFQAVSVNQPQKASVFIYWTLALNTLLSYLLSHNKTEDFHHYHYCFLTGLTY